MASSGSCKLFQSSGAKTGSFIQNKSAGLLVKNFEQPVDVHERQLIHWQKVSRSGGVRGPSIGIDIKERFSRCPSPFGFNFDKSLFDCLLDFIGANKC
jgi:hypothetical protein